MQAEAGHRRRRISKGTLTPHMATRLHINSHQESLIILTNPIKTSNPMTRDTTRLTWNHNHEERRICHTHMFLILLIYC
jgi:hypothetical protein